MTQAVTIAAIVLVSAFGAALGTDYGGITCDPPPTLNYGRYYPTKSSYVKGTILTFRCNYGYSMTGARRSICTKDEDGGQGYWRPSPPTCNHNSMVCPKPMSPRYGTVRYTGLTAGSRVQYGCNRNYELVGSYYRMCQNNGTWRGQAPTCRPITCPDLDSPQYGRVNMDSNTYGSKARYSCNDGYVLYGNEYRKCQYNKKWTGEAPTCKSVRCPKLVAPEYGTIQLDDTVYGSRVQYTCNRGYELYGIEYRTCGYNGKWSGMEPTCKHITCPDLHTPNYGSIIVKGYQYNSKAQYSCNYGYQLHGNEERMCGYDGQWTGDAPTCQAITCPTLSAPKYCRIDIKGTSHGSKVQYICNTGYLLYGGEYRICGSDGQWGGKAPTCKRITCQKLDAPDYGSVSASDSTYGSKATYVCDHGYEMYGQDYRTCEYNGKWSGRAPTCKRVSCPMLYAPIYGYININETKYESKVRYYCDHGYKLLGNEYRTCDYNGQWTQEAPSCIPITCSEPQVPQYASIDIKGYTYGSRAYYTCDYGYMLHGNEYQTCEYSGQWSGKTPICKAILCKKLSAPQYGTVNITESTAGSKANYGCNKGYELYGKAHRVCGYKGLWTEEAPICKPIKCTNLYAPTYGSIDVNSTVYGSKVRYYCDHGYQLRGIEYRTCDYLGEWTGDAPVCMPIKCKSPKVPKYGRVDVKSYTHGSKIYYFCDHGYQLQGDQYRNCDYNGQWSGDVPTCKPIKCPKLTAPEYCSVNSNDTVVGSMAKYTCNHGYILYGQTTRTCDYNGKWTGKAPSCQRVRCSVLYAPTYGSVEVNDTAAGSQGHYSCSHGYSLLGNEYRNCGYAGDWSDKAPVCIQITCPTPRAPQYGYIDINGLSYNSKAQHACNHGYYLEGDEYRTCQYDGTWSGETPTCKNIKCPKLYAPKYGSIEVNDTIYGSMIHYYCNHGYTLYGEEYRTCGYEGEWSGKEPSCKPIRCSTLYAPQYGGVDVNDIKYASQAHYYCNHGYTLKGEENRTCNYDGEWTGSAPTCEPIKCSRLRPPRYGFLEVKSYIINSRIRYSCRHGYLLYGDEYRTCEYSGKWSGNSPTCKQIKCPSLRAPKYGQIQVNSTVYDSKARYYCDHGYLLYGEQYRYCGYNAKWSGAVPTCKPIRCPRLYAPQYGSIDVNDTIHSSVAHYSCDHGYQLQGDSYVTCQYSGLWTKTPPKCIPITCPAPPPPKYSIIDVKGYSIGSKVYYVCEHGYKLYGNNYQTCDYNGKWTGKAPTCKRIICQDIYAPQYGSISVNETYTGSKVQYYCNHGYYLYGQSIRICDYNGEWTGKVPICKPIKCPQLYAPLYGSIDTNSTKAGSKAHYTCNHGYKLYGQAWRVCGYDRVWTYEAPTCKPIRCPKLTSIQYGSINVTSDIYNTQAYYKCNYGYKLYGGNSRTCGYDGLWTGEAPTCKHVRCPPVYAPLYGLVDVNDTIVGSRAQYSCGHGYYLYGKQWRTCDYNGEWTGKIPICHPIKCHILSDPIYGSVDVNGTKAGMMAHYSCKHGYYRQGDEYRTCDYSGQWTGTVPTCKPVRCPTLKAPQYGIIDVRGYTYSSVVEYYCDHGYKLYGDDNRTCLYTGKWSGSIPTCKAIKCPDITAPKYGSIDYNSTKAGSSAHYTCKHGYYLVGKAWRICNYNGYWTEDTPICKPIRCPQLYAPVYGRVSINDTVAGSKVQYYCNHGYQLYGTGYRTCGYDGVWKGDAPTCKHIRCPALYAPQYGSIDTNETVYETRARYICHHGYKRYGDEYRTCQYSGVWTGQVPTCKRIVCPALYAPMYGSIDVNETVYGSKCRYSCKHGYVLYGDEYRHCQYNSLWSGDVATCKPVKCPDVYAPTYGSVDANSTIFQSKVRYYCDHGYKLYGSEYRTCDYTGQWTEEPPTCKRVTCPTINAPQYGHVNVKDYTYGSRVQYICNHGYYLYGEEYRTCDYTGVWNGKPPTCKRITCPKVYAPKYGVIQANATTYGSQVIYSCYYGYELYGSTHRSCLYSGKWSGEEPTCKVISCPDLVDPTYGTVKVNDTTYGAVAKYHCNYGYVLHGLEYVDCGHGGRWSGDTPVCKPVRCPEIEPPKYGSASVRGYIFESEVYYTCNHGYELHGKESRKCGYTGTWSGTAPVCKPITCDYLEEPEHGTIEVGGYTGGNTATYICRKGYKLYGGSEHRTCQYDGQWTGEAPKCKAITCLSLSAPKYGSLDVNDTTAGSKAHYSCNHGYKRFGDEYRTCGYAGTWTGSEPICQPIRCPTLSAPGHGSIDSSSTSYGSTVRYSCEKGYMIYGEAERTCSYNGKWTGAEPTCKPVRCPELKEPMYGTVRVNGYTYNYKAQYICDSGYMLNGNEERKCQYDGTWSGVVPTCIGLSCPPLENPLYGYVNYDSATIGSKAMYTCQSGYEVEGMGWRICSEGGVWSNEVPTCKKLITCGDLTAPMHGSVTYKSKSIGSRAQYSCDTGYQVTGSQTRACLSNGQWSRTAPVCSHYNY